MAGGLHVRVEAGRWRVGADALRRRSHRGGRRSDDDTWSGEKCPRDGRVTGPRAGEGHCCLCQLTGPCNQLEFLVMLSNQVNTLSTVNIKASNQF